MDEAERRVVGDFTHGQRHIPSLPHAMLFLKTWPHLHGIFRTIPQLIAFYNGPHDLLPIFEARCRSSLPSGYSRL